MFLLAPASAFCPDTDVLAVKDLVPTKDAELVQHLQNILDSYRYTENYSTGRFDNMDAIVITTRILQDNGFNPSTIARFALTGRSGESHMWLAVPDGGGRFAFIETAAFASGIPSLGRVVDAQDSAEYNFGYVLLDPMQAMRCFGYADDRFLADIHKVEQIRPFQRDLYEKRRASGLIRLISHHPTIITLMQCCQFIIGPGTANAYSVR